MPRGGDRSGVDAGKLADPLVGETERIDDGDAAVDLGQSPGEIIVLFTDGVDEAMDPEGNLYTLERMRKFVAGCPHDVEELGKALLADVRRHANGRPQNDDITIMIFGRDA